MQILKIYLSFGLALWKSRKTDPFLQLMKIEFLKDWIPQRLPSKNSNLLTFNPCQVFLFSDVNPGRRGCAEGDAMRLSKQRNCCFVSSFGLSDVTKNEGNKS